MNAVLVGRGRVVKGYMRHRWVYASEMGAHVPDGEDKWMRPPPPYHRLAEHLFYESRCALIHDSLT